MNSAWDPTVRGDVTDHPRPVQAHVAPRRQPTATPHSRARRRHRHRHRHPDGSPVPLLSLPRGVVPCGLTWRGRSGRRPVPFGSCCSPRRVRVRGWGPALGPPVGPGRRGSRLDRAGGRVGLGRVGSGQDQEDHVRYDDVAVALSARTFSCRGAVTLLYGFFVCSAAASRLSVSDTVVYTTYCIRSKHK